MTSKLTFTPRAFILCNFYLTKLSLEMLFTISLLPFAYTGTFLVTSGPNTSYHIIYHITSYRSFENFIASSRSNFYTLLHTWSLTQFSVTSITV